MSSDIHLLNSKEAANILGVNVSSIKRWTDEGELECIRTIGGHRKFQIDHLSRFIENNRKKASKVNLFALVDNKSPELYYHIVKGNFEYLKSYLIKHALKCNRDNIQQVLTGLYLCHHPLYLMYDNLMTPVLHEIGDRWMARKLTITEEHLASQLIRDAIIRLQGIITIPGEKIGKVICLNISSELHDIALKMVQNILELRGFKTYYTGQITPFIDIDQVLTKIKPDRLYISSTMITDIHEDQQELNMLYDQCEKNSIQIYLGGQGFEQLDYSHPVVVRRLNTFEEVTIY